MAVLAIGLIAGCTGGGDPVEATTSAAPTPTPTSTPEPTPTRTPMAFPTPAPEISEPTPEGAIAAGTHFVALFDYAYATGDAGPFTAMSADGCEFCNYVRDEVQGMVDGGYASIREPARVIDADSTEIREDEFFSVHFRVEQGPLSTVMPDGEEHQTSDGATADFIIAMIWTGSVWQVEAVDLEKVPA